MNNPTNQPSHRPLREEKIEAGDEYRKYFGKIWKPVPKLWIGQKRGINDYPMRRPVKDL